MAEPAPRDTYRHGDLSAEAAAAAYGVVREGGLAALTVREVARRTGVAHRSLYNHYADRDALVDAVAERGYRELAEVLQGTRSRADFVRAYAGFALARPGVYEAMRSRPHATMKFRPSLQAAVHLGLAEARRLFGAADKTSAENRREVMKVLILLHGGIGMYRSGILDVDGDEGLIAELQAMLGD
jgi:AcrR family transcriptional regulator